MSLNAYEKSLYEALKARDAKTAREIIHSNDPEDFDFSKMPNGSDPFLLFAVYVCHDLALVEMMIEYGADIDQQADWGATALIVAAREGKLDIYEMLLSYGADVNLQTNDKKDVITIISSKRKNKDKIAKVAALNEKYALSGATKTITPPPKDGYWRLTGREQEVATIFRDKVLRRKTTQIYNFEKSERTTLSMNLVTGQEAMFIQNFADIANVSAIEIAAENYRDLSGEGSVTYQTRNKVVKGQTTRPVLGVIRKNN